MVQNSVHSFCKVESSPHDRPGAIGCLVNTTASQAKRMTRWGGGVAFTSKVEGGAVWMDTGQWISPSSPAPPSPASRPPALTIQCDAGIGNPKLVRGHTSIVPIILL